MSSDAGKWILRIQREYFDLLDSHFKRQRNECQRSGLDRVKFLSKLVNQPDILVPSSQGEVSPLEYEQRELMWEISSFWDTRGHELHSALRELDALTLLSQVTTDHISDGLDTEIRKFALYFDTVCVTDPLCVNMHLLRSWDRRPQPVDFLVYLCLLDLAPLALADCTPPMCTVYPPALYAGESGGEAPSAMQKQVDEDALQFVKEFFHVDGEVRSAGELADAIRFLPAQRIRAAMEDSPYKNLSALFSSETWRQMVFPRSSRLGIDSLDDSVKPVLFLMLFASRTFADLEYADRECGSLFLDPLIRGDSTKWELYKWKRRRNALGACRGSGLSEANAVIRTFDQKDLSWLGNVTKDDVVRLRVEGEMDEMRSLFRASWKHLKTATLEEFDKVAVEVYRNLSAALDEHSEKLKKEEQAYRKRLMLSGTSLAVTASLSVASLAMPMIAPLAIGSAVFSVAVGSKSVKDVVNEILTGKSQLKGLSKRPVGILWSARQKMIAPESHKAPI